MQKSHLTTPTLALSIALLSLSALTARPAVADEPGFTTLFNGKDFTNWHGERTMDPRKFDALSAEEKAKTLAEDAEDAKKHWKVVDGEMVNDGHGVFMTTDKDYGDVELFVDFKLLPKGDSGVYLRGTPQIQIWDTTEAAGYWKMGADKGSGGLWNNAAGSKGKDPLVHADNPIGQWNTFRIIQLGARTTIYLNGKLVVQDAILENYWDHALPIVAKGPIQLQTHGNEVRWRNIKVREIPADEANAYLSKMDGGVGSFTALFNGKDLTGWAGAVANYEVKDGAIRCKPKSGGVLYFDKEYKDFIARVEFKLPPGGNNGLAIRYPGHGDAAYDGMTELQVLDTEHEMYKTIDKRQAHGSAYGMVAAHRGYLRPTGEWNYQEVTVKGPKITVELNGTPILNADLSTVKEVMANSPHPGKDRTAGFFGFAGHGDAVEFRDIFIKPLD
ncbi:3-keto-disaccharide hydrolase [Paludisphaera borealis]|uniref:3-keto-alpha-glucoside-1,2-lyase/3-keto-2-hydroxy-glucal hydratase domain-containing protein n=1 Tax=Paludisphaera borealis TaxID=1387353 RepID=A0A1U7CSY2_9BACT|nr:DUF1080 domain-containing protein [Paludisphaera borealis]APW62006.1 putative beta-jelly-roll-type glycoside hydrolase of unknown function [Paludisphaera borealis]